MLGHLSSAATHRRINDLLRTRVFRGPRLGQHAQVRHPSDVRLMQSRLANNAIESCARTSLPSERLDALDVSSNRDNHPPWSLSSGRRAASGGVLAPEGGRALACPSLLATHSGQLSEYVQPRTRFQCPGKGGAAIGCTQRPKCGIFLFCRRVQEGGYAFHGRQSPKKESALASGSSLGVRCSGTDFGDLPSSPQIYPEDNWHCFEVYGPKTNYL